MPGFTPELLAGQVVNPVSLPPLITQHHIFGVSETDMPVLLDAAGLRLTEGQLPRPRSNEMALSREMANAMGIQIGDSIDRTVGRGWTGESWYDGIPAPLELVGILEGEGTNPDVRLGIVSYEFVDNHELFGPPWNSSLIVIPREGTNPKWINSWKNGVRCCGAR